MKIKEALLALLSTKMILSLPKGDYFDKRIILGPKDKVMLKLDYSKPQRITTEVKYNITHRDKSLATENISESAVLAISSPFSFTIFPALSFSITK